MYNEKNEIIENLKQKVNKIISLYKNELEKNNELEKKIKDLSDNLTTNKQNIINLQKNYDLLKIAKTVSNSVSDVNDTKNKINRIVREVDKCIALLNNE